MPTIISHPAVALALRPWLGGSAGREPLRASLIAAGAVAAILPDLDVIGFAFHVPYGSTFGHRGFTHSIVFALLVALAGARSSAATAAHSSTSFYARCRIRCSTR